MKTSKVLIALTVILALWLGTLIIGYRFFDSWQERGQFGDLFGAVNALFSGLAFAGLIYAIFLQRKELALQRRELKLQRQEMAESRKELAGQRKAQQYLFFATVAQIRVAAKQARIEALKIKAETVGPGGRDSFINAINALAQEIDVEADITEADEAADGRR